MLEQPWRIQLLGELRATLGANTISRFQTRKAGALLAFLAFFPQRPASRDELSEHLWPYEAPEVSRNRLRVALSSLRRQMEPPGVPSGAVLAADRTSVQMRPAAFL